jgi:hypothetical protein
MRRRQRSDDGPEDNIARPNNIDDEWNKLMNCKKKDNDEMVSATKIKNYLMDDPFCDWLSMYYTESTKKEFPKTPEFLSALFENGIKFEEKIMEVLKSTYKDNFVIINTTGARGNNSCNFEKTKDHILKGTPIIAQAVLFNESNNTYGCADLLVRSDYINKMIHNTVLTPEEIKIRGSKINLHQFHYRVIDIKWTTLPLRANGNCLTKEGFIPAYKGQLAIYNCALGAIQGYIPNQAYILGKGWRRTKDRQKLHGNNSFDILGVVDYSIAGRSGDLEVIEKTIDAINWIRELKENGSQWSIDDVPGKKHKCMFPNMCVDNPIWNNVKKEVALKTHEVTLICHVGKQQRDILHSKGIYGYNDPECNSKNMGINTFTETAEHIDGICDINRGIQFKILPQVMKNEYDDNELSHYNNWQMEYPTDMFFDFETVSTSTFNSEMDVFDSGKNSQIIVFMIGVGYIEKTEWKYKVFWIENPTKDDENKCFDSFRKFVIKKTNELDPKKKYKRRLFHWTHAEITNINNGEITQGQKWKEWAKTIDFVDMHKICRIDSVNIKGAFNFSLKSIGNALYDLGKIAIKWPDSEITNGRNAMFAAEQFYRNRINGNSNEKDKQTFEDIIKYNEIDCRMVYEVVNYFRKNHSSLDKDYHRKKK